MSGEGLMVCDMCQHVSTDDYCVDCGAFLCAACMRRHRADTAIALPAGERLRADVKRVAEARLKRARDAREG